MSWKFTPILPPHFGKGLDWKISSDFRRKSRIQSGSPFISEICATISESNPLRALKTASVWVWKSYLLISPIFSGGDSVAVSLAMVRGFRVMVGFSPDSSFNPKPEAMAGSGLDCPLAAPAIASGFGLNGMRPWSRGAYPRCRFRRSVPPPFSTSLRCGRRPRDAFGGRGRSRRDAVRVPTRRRRSRRFGRPASRA